MYRLVYFVVLFGFFIALVENKLLNVYDPNMCVLHVYTNKTGVTLFDVSSKSGILNLYNYTYAPEDETYDLIFPLNTVIEIKVYLCSYMKVEREEFECGQQMLFPPSACAIISKPNVPPDYHSMSNMSVSYVSKGFVMFFETDYTNKENLDIKIIFTNSSSDETLFYVKDSNHLEVKWSSTSFSSVTEKSVNNSCLIQIDSQSSTKVYDIRPLTNTPIYYKDQFKFVLSCTDVKIFPYQSMSSSNEVFHGSNSLTSSGTSQLVYSSNKGLYIRYPTVTNDSKYFLFSFKCSPGKTRPEVKMIKGRTYVFEIYSMITCSQNTTNCQLDLKPIRFSFDDLSANVQNYELSTSRGSKVIFNLCRSLLPTVGQTFTGGDILAALYDPDKGNIINLGVESHPTLVNNNIQMTYKGGDKCGEEGNYSLSIQLICNRYRSFKPKLLLSNDSCYYRVRWETKAACPYMHHEFSECSFQDANQFKLNLISLGKSDYNVTTPIGDLYINACGNLTSYPQASAILRKGSGDELIFGRIKPMLELRDGVINFRFKGDSCRDGVFFSLLIVELFTCRNENKIQLLTESDSCIFHVQWFAKDACTSESASLSDCSAMSEAGSYNLSSLSGVEYSVSNQDQIIHFTICSRLTGASAILCGTSSACWISNHTDEIYGAIGFQGSDDSSKENHLEVMGGKLVLNYSSRSKCGEHYYKFRVEFVCTPYISGVGLNIIDTNDDCIVLVQMRTNHSCSSSTEVIIQHATPTTSLYSCRTSTDTIMPKIDLSHLIRQEWDSKQYKVKVSICSALPSEISSDGSGICVETTSRGCLSLGKASDVLLYKPRLPYLNYTGPGLETTLITFPCSQTDIKNYRRLNDITHIVTWPSAASCFNQSTDEVDVSCYLDEMNSMLGVYKVNVSADEGKYILVGLCSQLPLGCLEGSGACLIEYYNDLPTYTSLGYPEKKIMTDNFGNKVFKFTDGAMCDRNGQQYRTIVKLICDVNSTQEHIIYSYEPNNCTYEISLHICSMEIIERRSQARKEKEMNETPGQGDKNKTDFKRQNFSLDPCSPSSPVGCLIDNLSASKPVEVSTAGRQDKYLVEFDFNGAVPIHCGASLCRYKTDYWQPVAYFHNITYFSSNKTYKLEYEGLPPSLNTACNGYFGAEMFMQCKEVLSYPTSTSFSLHPTLKWENECTLGIEWLTDLACIHTHPHISSVSESQGNNWTMIIITILSILLPCIIIFILRKKFCKFFWPLQGRFNARFTMVHNNSSQSSLSNGDETTTLFINPHIRDSEI